MPYIRSADKARLDLVAKPLLDYLESPMGVPFTDGELNYLMTRLAQAYMKNKPAAYRTYNTIMGVFTSAAQEFYRRVVGPYEDLKIAENGDVYK